jgi:carbon monoxide dehydrogenase subunit G
MSKLFGLLTSVDTVQEIGDDDTTTPVKVINPLGYTLYGVFVKSNNGTRYFKTPVVNGSGGKQIEVAKPCKGLTSMKYNTNVNIGIKLNSLGKIIEVIKS